MRREHLHSNARAATDREPDEVFTAPHAIVRGADGRSRWVALCPRCAEQREEAVVTGDEDQPRAVCAGCGATVEVRVSGLYRVARTLSE